LEKLKPVLYPLSVITVLLVLWSTSINEDSIFPSPLQVVTGAFELVRDGTLWEHIGASLARVGSGFALALAFAIPLGLWMGRIPVVYMTLNPVFQIFRPISPIAWIPVAILWFGVGNASPVFLIFIAAVFPLLVQTASAVQTIDQRYLRAGANFGASRRKLLLELVIPAVLPEIIVGMRISLGVAWLVVVAAEMIALRSGLGYLIMDSRNAGNRYDLVVAAMVVIGLIGLMLDALMRRLERLKVVRWRYRQWQPQISKSVTGTEPRPSQAFVRLQGDN
jgi:NitT/TauT family transport system permease protein